MAKTKILTQDKRPGKFEEVDSLQALGGVLWTQTSVTTLSRWTTTASMLAEQPLIPGGVLRRGMILRVKLRGAYKTLSSTIYSMGVILDGITISKIEGFSPAKSNGVSTNKGWSAEALICCSDTNKVTSQLDLMFNVGGSTLQCNQLMSPELNEYNIDFSKDLKLDFRCATSAAVTTNVFSVMSAIVEVLV